MENEKTYLEQVGERLGLCRRHNFLSRAELSKRTDVKITTISALEHGNASINIEDAVKICKELDCSIEYLLTGNCGMPELIRLNQKFLNLPDIHSDNLQKNAKAFWSTCPIHK